MTVSRKRAFPPAARIGLVLVAVACAFWLAASWRNESLQASATRHLRQGPAGAALAESDLRSAQYLNAGFQPDLLLVSALAAQGRTAQARAVAAGIARSEPENLAAWALLGDVAQQSGDQGLAAYARRRAMVLAGNAAD